MILALFALVFGFILMWILSWLTATPVRVVRAALNRVEQGDFDTQSRRVRRHRTRAAATGFQLDGRRAARTRTRARPVRPPRRARGRRSSRRSERPKLGGEERHAAVIFVDIIGSTQLVTSRPAIEVVELLNRFFAVDRRRGRPPPRVRQQVRGRRGAGRVRRAVLLDNPEDEALAAARAIAERLREEVPECQAGIGVAAGQVVAGNVGAKERFEYTVIGEPVNEAARLCELAKRCPAICSPRRTPCQGATESERARWTLGDTVTLRGHDEPTRLATPV